MKKYKLSLCGLFLIVGIASVLAVPTRLHQLLSCLDRSTGFWLVKDISYPILIALTVAAVLASLLIPLLSNQLPRAEFMPLKSKTLAAASLLTVFGFLSDAILRMLEVADLWTAVQTQTQQVFTYYISSGFIPKLFQIIFGLLSAVYFLFLVKATWKRTTEYQRLKLLALSPVLWGIARMMVHFVEPISYRNVSQLMLELFFVGFYLIFALEFARIAGGVNAKNSVWSLYFSGSAAVFFGVTEAFPTCFLTIFGSGHILPDDYPAQFVDFALVLFLTAVLVWYSPCFARERGYNVFPEASTPAPAKLFTPEEPDSPVRPSAAAGSKTIPADRLKIKNQEPDTTVLPKTKE